jgi:hypothetical protein
MFGSQCQITTSLGLILVIILKALSSTVKTPDGILNDPAKN